MTQLPFSDAADVFSVSFHEGQSGLGSTKFTHENVTAGVAAVRSMLPTSNMLSVLDTIVSAHPLNTIYGRVIAYTAIYEGTSFATLSSAGTDIAEERRFSHSEYWFMDDVVSRGESERS